MPALPSPGGGAQGSMDGVRGSWGGEPGSGEELDREGESGGKVSGPGVVSSARRGDRKGRKEVFMVGLSVKPWGEGKFSRLEETVEQSGNQIFESQEELVAVS